MKDNILKFALAASLILNITVLATAGYRYYAQSPMWVSPFGKVMHKNHFLFEQLSLEPAQLAEMKKNAILFRAEIDRRRQEINTVRKELVGLMRFENPDKQAIDSLIKKISIKQEEMQRMIAGHMLEVKASLDGEQQRKFLDLVEQSMMAGQISCPPDGAR